MSLHGYSSSTKAGLILDSGQLRIANTIIGVTRGSVRFDPGEEIDEVDFDGKRQPIEGLDRMGFRRALITATLLEAASARILQYIPGSATNTVGGIETITPPDAGTWLTSLTNVRAIFEMGDGTYTEFRMARAMPKWGGVEGADRDEAGMPMTFEARALGTDGNTINDATYLVLKYATIPTL